MQLFLRSSFCAVSSPCHSSPVRMNHVVHGEVKMLHVQFWPDSLLFPSLPGCEGEKQSFAVGNAEATGSLIWAGTIYTLCSLFNSCSSVLLLELAVLPRIDEHCSAVEKSSAWPLALRAVVPLLYKGRPFLPKPCEHKERCFSWGIPWREAQREASCSPTDQSLAFYQLCHLWQARKKVHKSVIACRKHC